MARPMIPADSYINDSVFEESDGSDLESLPGENDYFAQRSHPEAESKAQEAATEQRTGGSSAFQHSQLSSPALSAMSMPWSEPDFPTLSMNPPDYATATANRPAYGSIQQSARQQQSMSDALPSRVDEESGLLSSRPQKRGRRCRPRWCGPVSTCNTALILAVVALIILLAQAADSGRKNRDGGNLSPKLPKIPDNGDNDGNKSDPPKTPSNSTEPPYFPPSSECAYQHYSDTQYFDFPNLQNFSFMEFMESSNHLSGGVDGTLYIHPSTQSNQDVDIRLRVAYATTSPFRVVKSNYIRDDDSFTLDLPDLQKSHEGSEGRPCLGVFVGAEIRKGATLENWAVSTGNLDIIVADGLFNSRSGEGDEEQSHLQVFENSIFNAVRGKANIAYWQSRRTIIEFISGSIQGTFALRDLVALKTVSGNINAFVDPKNADPDLVMPAEFHAVSSSGNIDVLFPSTGEIPSRDYRTRLETVSSSILGTYIAGTSTSIHSISGNADVELLPYHYSGAQTLDSMHTDSGSGTTKLKVLSPYIEDSWPKYSPQHRSTSTSGSIDVIYPQQWEGNIEGRTTSGSISIKGKDVEIIGDEGFGPLLKHVTARKGVGSGRMAFKTISGSINVRIGDA